MKKTFQLLCTVLMLLFVSSGTTRADLITFTQVFPGGFDVSINGGPLTPSGSVTIVGVLDDGSPDLDGGGNGEFALSSLTFSGAGFLNETVTNPMGLLVWGTDKFAFQRLGEFNEGITGWNGTSISGSFISDLGDLTTLFGLPYSTTGTSSFWYDGLGVNEWSLGSGDTIGADLGAGGPDGTFSISATAIPEPSSLALLVVGLGGLLCYRRIKKA